LRRLGCSLRRRRLGTRGLGCHSLRRRSLWSGPLLRDRNRLPGRKLILKLRHLLPQSRHIIGITIRFRRLVGAGIVHQRIPLLARLMQIQSRLAVKCETEQKQSGYRCHGRNGKAHVNPPLSVALPHKCDAHATDTTKVIVFSVT
jgi:hypothetical protein